MIAVVLGIALSNKNDVDTSAYQLVHTLNGALRTALNEFTVSEGEGRVVKNTGGGTIDPSNYRSCPSMQHRDRWGGVGETERQRDRERERERERQTDTCNKSTPKQTHRSAGCLYSAPGARKNKL